MTPKAVSRDDTCLCFMAIPGVGPIAALTFKAAMDDPKRFSSGNETFTDQGADGEEQPYIRGGKPLRRYQSSVFKLWTRRKCTSIRIQVMHRRAGT